MKKGGGGGVQLQDVFMILLTNFGFFRGLAQREGCDDVKVGFKIKNDKGIRYKGYSFDDNNIDAGNNQPRNICALARCCRDPKSKTPKGLEPNPQDPSTFTRARQVR